MKAKSTFSLKDQIFTSEKVDWLAGLISAQDPKFVQAKFRKEVLSKFPELELKERIFHIAECLEKHLPDPFPEACEIIVKSLPPELDPDREDDDFGDFILAPLSHYIVRNGCSRKHLKRSLKALREITMRFSAEDAIRYFINRFPDETFGFLEVASRDKNYHVRRLASEGSRPRLPWSQKLVTTHEIPLPILDQLHKDPTRYVTRSVANHLNDISKIAPDVVIDRLEQWSREKSQLPGELNYITRHALRTLVKQGHSGALTLLGFGNKPSVTIHSFEASPRKIVVGEVFELAVNLTSHRKQNLLIDYLMEFPGGRSRIFKLKQISPAKGESVVLAKRHPMRLMTTRAQVPGTHRISLQINGRPFGSTEFELF